MSGQDVGKIPRDGDAACARQNSIGIECKCALQKIIRGISIEESSDARTLRLQIRVADDHQALFPVSNIKKAVEQGDRLFFVFGKLETKRIDTERRRGRYCNGISCWHMEFLAHRRNLRCGHGFVKTLVVDVREFKKGEPTFSLRC